MAIGGIPVDFPDADSLVIFRERLDVPNGFVEVPLAEQARKHAQLAVDDVCCLVNEEIPLKQSLIEPEWVFVPIDRGNLEE